MDGQYFLDLLFTIVEGVLVAAAPVLVGLAAVWIKAKIEEVKARIENNLSDQQRWLLETAANIAVSAAEQMKLAELIEDKKDYAMGVAQKYLDNHSINLHLDVIEAAIEKAVRDLNNGTET